MSRGIIWLLLVGGQDVPSGLHPTSRRIYHAAWNSSPARTVSSRFRCLPQISTCPLESSCVPDRTPEEFAQFRVPQSAVQVHYQGGVYVLAPQLAASASMRALSWAL